MCVGNANRVASTCSCRYARATDPDSISIRVISNIRSKRSMMFDVDEKLHARLVISLSLIARALALVLVYVGAVASTPFDSSHLALEPVAAPLEKWALSGLRWDVFHFTHIAQNGYVYEYEYAFMPGTPAIMRLAAFVAQILGVIRWDRTPSQGELLVCGFMMSTLLDPTWSLYKFVVFVE